MALASEFSGNGALPLRPVALQEPTRGRLRAKNAQNFVHEKCLRPEGFGGVNNSAKLFPLVPLYVEKQSRGIEEWSHVIYVYLFVSACYYTLVRHIDSACDSTTKLEVHPRHSPIHI